MICIDTKIETLTWITRSRTLHNPSSGTGRLERISCSYSEEKRKKKKKRNERGIGDNHWSRLSLHFLTIVRRSSGRLPSVFRCHCIVSIEFSWLLYVHNISASLSPIRRPSFLLFSCSIAVTHTKPRLYIFALRSWPRYKAALCLLLITFTNSRASIRARGCSVGKIDPLRHSAHHRFGTDRLRV